MTTSTKKILLGALVVPAIALAAACTSSSHDKVASASADRGDSAGASVPAASPPEDFAPNASRAAVNGTTASLDGLASTGSGSKDAANVPNLAPVPDESSQAPQAPEAQAIISKGQISLHSKDIKATRFELQKVLDTLNGTIADEQADADKKGNTIRERLVLRVPSAKFGKAMDQISALGTLVNRSRSSEDVTTQVIDNKTRVATQRASLARIQALLSRAQSLQDVISIESQLSRRQANLDSLEAQQKYLADQTSLSTIDVYLTVPSKKHAAHKDSNNFFSGFKSGWDHLGSSTNALLTGLGAVLPFAVVLALIGFPAWGAWRRRSVKVAEA